jgi:hypothetical protein
MPSNQKRKSLLLKGVLLNFRRRSLSTPAALSLQLSAISARTSPPLEAAHFKIYRLSMRLRFHQHAGNFPRNISQMFPDGSRKRAE